MILVFSNKDDVHCNPVIRHLAEMGQRVLRINTECLMTEYEVRFEVRPDAPPELAIRCTANGLAAVASEVTAIWERRPSAPAQLPGDDGADPLRGELRKVALEEAEEFARWVRCHFSDRFSIGSFERDSVAECKTLQARIAWDTLAAHGAHPHVRIPPTVISNEPAAVRAFARVQPSVAVKPVSADGASAEEGQEFPFLTQRVRGADLLEMTDESIRSAPVFLQPYIEKEFEARITVVAGQIFPCRIDTQHLPDDRGRIDWRAGYGHGMRHSRYSPPADVLLFCERYLAAMGLSFGCFDFVVDPHGTHWFLECNPNGQWLWIEHETGMPISRAIAHALATAGARSA